MPAMADISTIPDQGTVFIGEEGLDISACGVSQGDTIGWWGNGGPYTSEPSDTVTISDPASFYIAPVLFAEKTGPWYSYPDKKLVIYVKEPQLAVRIMDTTSDFDATGKWVPTGQTIGFRLENNLYDLKNRPGVTGAPVDISIVSPDGLEYSSVSGNRLDAIPVDGSPYETGGIWNTYGEEAGYYSVQAKCTANHMDENNQKAGAAQSETVRVQIQSVNPLIKDFSKPEETVKISGDNEKLTERTPTQQSVTPVEDSVTTNPTQPVPEKTVNNTDNSPNNTTGTISSSPPVNQDNKTTNTSTELASLEKTEPITQTQGPAPAPTATSPGFSFLLAFCGITMACLIFLWKT